MQGRSKDPLRLENQLCFPLYAASRLLTRLYQPLLEPLGVTYPQYMVLLALWQHGSQTVSEIGEKTFLESNTLTPLLKKLEAKELVTRTRRHEDERVVEVALTRKGVRLKDRAKAIPAKVAMRTGCSLEQTTELKSMLHDFLRRLGEDLQE